MDDYEDFDEDVDVYYAAFEQADEEHHHHHGCGGCLLVGLVTLVFAIIFLILFVI
jgi:hypothetical protein